MLTYNSNGHQMSRSHNSTTIPQHSQIKKIFCAYHPNQFLTNFCCDSQCLMPLCPNCIVEHTEQHFLQNNKPCYVNLSEALNDTKQKCYQNIVMFQELNKANDKIYDYIMGVRESIHNQLLQDKQEIFKEIDRLFENYQQKLLNQTLLKYKELEVYDRKETISIGEFITEQVEVIHDQIAILKGENCLAGLINFYKNDGKIYEDSIKEISDYVNKHKKAGKISIQADLERLTKTLQNFCEENLVIQFISEEDKSQEARLKSSTISREGSSHKTFSQKLVQRGNQVQCAKQNNFNQSNQQFRSFMKRGQQYYKIDPAQLKPVKAVFNPIPASQMHPSCTHYQPKQVGVKHRY